MIFFFRAKQGKKILKSVYCVYLIFIENRNSVVRCKRGTCIAHKHMEAAASRLPSGVHTAVNVQSARTTELLAAVGTFYTAETCRVIYSSILREWTTNHLPQSPLGQLTEFKSSLGVDPGSPGSVSIPLQLYQDEFCISVV